ncbi:VOC family protein [Micromonospora sp. NPDC003197]
MANGRSRPIAPVRKLIAAVLGTVATFVTLFGLGMTSWSIVALGVALLVLAVALVVVRTGGRAWVTGIAHVHSASEPPTAYSFGRCELQIVIDAPGLPPRSKKIIEPRVPIAKWPVAGQTLPIKIAIDDHRHLRILWDDVPTHTEAAAANELPPEFDDLEPLADDVLLEEDAPPWARPRPDDGYPSSPPPRGPMPVDLTDDLGGGLREREDPVVVRQTAGGTIVLEGTLVETPTPPPLPRRPRTSPDLDEPGPTPASRQEVDEVRLDEVQPDTRRDEVEPDDVQADDVQPDSTRRDAVEPDDVQADDVQDDSTRRHDVQAEPGSATDSGSSRDSELHDDDLADLVDLVSAYDTDPTPESDRPDPADDEDVILADLIGPTSGAAAGAAGPFQGVGITLLVTDLDRSVRFYRDMLGFFEIDGGEGNAVLASNSTRLVLRAIPEAAPINRRLVHLNLEVDDLEAVYENLKDKGVRFTYAPRAVNRGAKLELWAAAFRDPDGHGIALTQWRDRPVGQPGPAQV